jgi:hypothetical protein
LAVEVVLLDEEVLGAARDRRRTDGREVERPGADLGELDESGERLRETGEAPEASRPSADSGSRPTR